MPSLLAEEVMVARRSARKASRAVLLFGTWLLVTWLGPALEPQAGYSWLLGAALLALYAVLTLVAVLAVYWGASRVVVRGVMRRVVSTYLAPFWLVVLVALGAGAAVFFTMTDPLSSVWLTLGMILTVLSAAYAGARVREVRALDLGRRDVSPRRREVGPGTWQRELRARLEAARSMRLE